MNRPISRPLHGLGDYSYVAAVSIAPTLLGFEDEPRAVRMCRVLSGSALVSALLTRAEWGVVRALPYRTHLALDVLLSVTALGAPWLLGFADNTRARTTLLAVGAFGLGVVVLSRTDEMPAQVLLAAGRRGGLNHETRPDDGQQLRGGVEFPGLHEQ